MTERDRHAAWLLVATGLITAALTAMFLLSCGCWSGGSRRTHAKLGLDLFDIPLATVMEVSDESCARGCAPLPSPSHPGIVLGGGSSPEGG